MNKRSASGQYHNIQQKANIQENISVSPNTTIVKINRNGTVLTMKKMKITPEESTIPPNMIRELAIPSELNSQFIIHPPITDIRFDPEDQTISYVYEYGAVDIRKVQIYHMNKKAPISETTTKSIIFQILLGLDYMHSRGIAHCNVTPAHLMIMPTTSQTPGVLRFINFSLARVTDSTNKVKPNAVISAGYRAPEIILGSTDYSYSADIWSTGVIFSELLTGQLFYTPRQDQDQRGFQHMALMSYIDSLGPMNYDDFPRHDNYTNWGTFQQFISQMMSNPNMRNQKGKLYTKLSNLSPDAQDLLFKMLVYDPDRRITAKEALRHPYFNSKPFPVMNLSRTFTADDWKALVVAGGKE